MIDIHCHILPMVDDGAKSVEMALQMLSEAYQSGTDAVVLTPHHGYPYTWNNPKEKIQRLFADLQHIVQIERIPIELYLGTELLFISKSQFMDCREQVQTMNDTRYLLMEFQFDAPEEEILSGIDAVIGCGQIPIVAHPERYDDLQLRPEFAADMIQAGALLQMNKSSLLGIHGDYARETAMDLLAEQAYSFVGSDAHNLHLRNSMMAEAQAVVRRYFGVQYAYEIFVKNPSDMLRNVDIRKRN